MENYKIKTIGEVSVDSGQVFLVDPCYIKKDTLGNEEMNYNFKNKKFLNDPTLNNKKNFYTNICERTLVGNSYGNTQSGFATRTTHGDGTYKVKGIFDEYEGLRGLFISFVDDLEINAFDVFDDEEIY